MLKIIDWYIIRKFLGTFFYAIGLIILIVIIFDFSERVDDFIENEAPIKEIIFVYYLNFIPYFANLFSPLFTFIAVIFFTSRMAFNTEIVAILSNGISFKRMLLPYIISAVILSIFSIYLSNFLIPNANENRLDFESKYIKKQTRFKDRNIHLQIRPGTFIYLESFNERNNYGYSFAMETIKDGELKSKIRAETIKWQEEEKNWRMSRYSIRKIDGLEEELSSGRAKDTILNFTPKDFMQSIQDMETMNFSTLNDFIENERIKGSENIKYYLVEKHRRIAFPFSTIVLTLIGVALSSRKVKGGIGLHLGIGLALSFGFILFMQITTTFATNGNLPAWLSLWIPNFIFAILGIYLIYKAPK
ncbi:MAG: LptF/LptG family permease [Bacteroidales bacterium]